MVQLANYQTEVGRLLRDRSHIMTPLDELNEYINEARNDVAKITGCLRAHIAGNAPWGNGATAGLMTAGGMILGNADTTLTTFATQPGQARVARSSSSSTSSTRTIVFPGVRPTPRNRRGSAGCPR